MAALDETAAGAADSALLIRSASSAAATCSAGKLIARAAAATKVILFMSYLLSISGWGMHRRTSVDEAIATAHKVLCQSERLQAGALSPQPPAPIEFGKP